MRFKVLFSAFTFIFFNAWGQVVINEYSAANFDGFTDNYGEYEDWFEIYNPGGTAIDLNGYYVSDKDDNLTKWQFSASVLVPANGHLMVYCSGRDEVNATNAHTNFKLTQTKGNEWIILTNPNGTTVEDSVWVKRCQTNHSRGRDTNGSANWGVFSTPTPNNNNANAFTAYATKPSFSLPSGYHTGSANITVTSAGNDIYYTDNGDFPDNTTNVYTAPINITNTTVIKARAYSTNPSILPSFIEYNTYFINDTHTMPILSVSGNQVDDLLNGSGWLDPIGSFEYFDEAGQLLDKARGDFNKHGNDSWAYDQRGFDYITRDQLGYNHEIQNQIFNTKDRDGFQRLIIKAAANDNYPFSYGGTGAHIRDAYINSLSQVADLRLDERSYDPCIVYLNGQYWGVYEIREKVDDLDFTDYYYDQGKGNVDFLKTWGGTWEEYGTDTGWVNIRNFILGNDMSIPANYQHAKSYLNTGSLIDYFILNMYVVCADWLNWNTAWWRGTDPDGEKKKWRYALWDMDNTFGHGTNYTGVPTQGADADPCDPESLSDPGGQGHVPIWNELLNNDEFFASYINRWSDLSNTYFSCDFMIQHLDSLINIIEPEMNGQINRWNAAGGGTYAGWESNVQDMKDYIELRCSTLNSAFVDCYDVYGPYNVTILIDGIGEISFSDITINNSNSGWSGEYFGGIDISALVQNGNFTMWEILGDSTYTFDPFDPALTLNLVCDITLIAHFDASLITYVVDPSDKGEISVNGTAITTYPHTQLHLNGDVVNLTQTTENGYSFENWSSNYHTFTPNANTESVSLTVAQADTIVLNLSRNVYTISLHNSPTNAEGLLYMNNLPVNSFPYTENFFYDDIVDIRAGNTPKWEFDHWTSNQFVPNGTTDLTYSFKVTDNDDITAHFNEIIYYDITFDIHPTSDAGEIQLNNIPDNHNYPFTQQFRAGSDISLESIENNGWKFIRWDSNEVPLLPNNESKYVESKIVSDGNVTAVFEEILDIYIPNTFTPNNGDIKNNTFNISIHTTSEFTFNISIYNRWGEEMFSSNDISKSWDGINKNSNTYVPLGVYTYIVEVSTKTGKHKQERGTVTILR